MKTNLVKNVALITVILTLALLGTACGSSNKNAGASSSAAGTESSTPGDSAAAASESAAASPQSTPDILSGEFNGAVDSHTIEIKTGAGPLSYQVSTDIADKVSTWEPGTKVKYQYKENTITAIDKE